jgi:homoaconitate hydratase
MGQTIAEKIAQAHLAEGPKRPLRTGDFVAIRPHRVMTNNKTSAVIKKFQTIGAKKIENSQQLVFVLEHDLQDKDESNLHRYEAIEGFAKYHGVDFHPAGLGIGHQIMVERGYVTPGSFVVACDSHSHIYGALGAIGTPIVLTDAAAAWATGDFWWRIPRSIQVVLEGELPAGATGKDVIITLCGLYNHDEVLNAAVEFSGAGVASLSMDARFSVSNMSTDWGALAGWFPVDAVTIKYLQGVKQRLTALGIERFADRDIANWLANPPQPDRDAVYAARIVLDLSQVTPHVSGPNTVRTMTSVAEIEKKKVPIQKAVLSCAVSRVEDLAAAATVLQGKKVASGVKLYVGAASKWVQEEAERRGIWRVLLDAGASPLPSGSGPGIGINPGLLKPGEMGISSGSRGFMGSSEGKYYLASPVVVAASAVAGHIRGHYKMADRTPARVYEEFPTSVVPEKVEILPGFPERVRGRLVFLPQDNVNAGAIYGKNDDLPGKPWRRG